MPIVIILELHQLPFQIYSVPKQGVIHVFAANRSMDLATRYGRQHFLCKRKECGSLLISGRGGKKHDHFERNHQGLDNRLIISSNPTLTKTGTVQTRRRLGGMLNYYYREAA